MGGGGSKTTRRDCNHHPRRRVCVSHLMTRGVNDLVRGERKRFVTQVCVQNLLQNFSTAHRTEERGQWRAAGEVTFPDWNRTPQPQAHKQTKNSSVT